MIPEFVGSLRDLVGTGERGFKRHTVFDEFLLDKTPAPDWYPLGCDHFCTVFWDIVPGTCSEDNHSSHLPPKLNFRNISIIIPKPLLAHSSSQYSVTWVMWTLLNPYAQDMKIYGIYLDLTSSEPPWINVIDSGLSWVSCQMLGFLQRPKVSSKLYQG